MKKNTGSLFGWSRRNFVLLGLVLALVGFGLVAFKAGAKKVDQDSAKQGGMPQSLETAIRVTSGDSAMPANHSLAAANSFMGLSHSNAFVECIGDGGYTSVNRDPDAPLSPESLAAYYSVTLPGDYVAGGVGLRGNTSGNITIGGIPAASTIEAAYLYYAFLDNGESASLKNIVFNGTPSVGTLIGTGPDTCWGLTNSYSYRADVTSLVSGNGTYALTGVASGGAIRAQGAGLVVVYRNGAVPTHTVLIYNGNDALFSGGQSTTTTINGFTASASPTAKTTFLVGDGQGAGNSGSFTGSAGTAPFTDPFGAGDGLYWDTDTFDVSAQVGAGSTSATTTVGTTGDCLQVVAQVFSVTSGRVARFYWSESTSWNAPGTGGKVMTADSNGLNPTQVTSGFNRIDDVELDIPNSRLFFNNWASGAPNNATEGIYRINTNGTSQLKITGVAQSNSTSGAASGLHGIALDPVDSTVYFTRGVSYADNNGGPEVSKVNPDGTGYQRLNTANTSWFTSGVALDECADTLYFGSPGVLNTGTGGAVNKVQTDGTGQVNNLVGHTDGRGRATALDPVNGLVFYSSWSISNPSTGGGIFVYNLNNSSNTQILNVPTTGITDLEVDVEGMTLYWVDFTGGAIRSATYNTAGVLGSVTTNVSGRSNPYGLALELPSFSSCATAPVVSGTKTVATSGVIGAPVTYTVTLNNTGTGAQGDNPGNEFVDVLPANLTLVSASATSGTAVATVGTNTVTWNGSIAAAGSVTITINATIKPGTAGQTASNQGTINWDADGNGTNETSSLTDDPGVGGANDPTNFGISKANTTTTVTAVPASGAAVFGQSVTFTATVAVVSPGVGTPTGTVTFNIDGNLYCINTPLNGSSQATCTQAGLPALGAGVRNVVALYSGNANFNGSAGTLNYTVNKADTITTITGDTPDPTIIGQPYAVTWTTVPNPIYPGSGVPTGNVTVSDGTGGTCTAAASAGTCNLTSTTVGNKTLVATYAGDANFNGSTSPGVPHTVNLQVTGTVRQAPAMTPLAGVTMTLSGCASATTTTDASGQYTFAGQYTGNCTITPSGLGKVYDPINRTYNNVLNNISGADFTAYDTIGGAARTITLVTQYVTPGAAGTMPVILNSQGNEASVAFSISYDINLFAQPPIPVCGSNAPGCTLVVDNSILGRVGVTITPAGGAFSPAAPGPKEILRFNFQTLANNLPSTPINFVSSPTPQLVKDAANNPLLVNWVNGLVVFAQSIEGDVAPRNAGNGVVDSSDVVQVRRFVTGLDTPVANFNEFQRADVAPASTSGDGFLDSTDVIQTRRYGAGLDSPRSAGGPGASNPAPLAPSPERTTNRAVMIGSSNATNDSRVSIPVELTANGDEVAASFTVRYDETRLTAPRVDLAKDAPEGMTLTVNTTEPGLIRVLVDSTTAIGRNSKDASSLINITFDVTRSAASGDTMVELDELVISDAEARSLRTRATSGTISISGPNPLDDSKVERVRRPSLRSVEMIEERLNQTTVILRPRLDNEHPRTITRRQ